MRFRRIFLRIICVSDFCCGDDVSDKEKYNDSYELFDTSAQDSTVHDNNENNTDAESERDNDSPEEENSDLATSFETSQQNLSSSRDAETDNTPMNVSSDSYHDVNLTNTPSQSCRNTPVDTNSPIITNIENTILSNNNDSEDPCLNNNIKESIDVGSLLDSPPESVNSKGTRYYIFVICNVTFT